MTRDGTSKIPLVSFTTIKPITGNGEITVSNRNPVFF